MTASAGYQTSLPGFGVDAPGAPARWVAVPVSQAIGEPPRRPPRRVWHIQEHDGGVLRCHQGPQVYEDGRGYRWRCPQHGDSRRHPTPDAAAAAYGNHLRSSHEQPRQRGQAHGTEA